MILRRRALHNRLIVAGWKRGTAVGDRVALAPKHAARRFSGYPRVLKAAKGGLLFLPRKAKQLALRA